MGFQMCARLTDKRVLITGASGGIGAAMAALFASSGAAVGLHYHRGRRAAFSLHRQILRRGGIAECFQADLAAPGAAQALMQAFLHRFHRIDVLINNAGAVIDPQGFTELTEAGWDQTLALNAKAPCFLAQAAFRAMKRQRGGKIINISSIAAKYGGSAATLHYGAAKAALDALTIGMARVGAPYNILVNSIRPGVIQTAFHRKIGRTSLSRRVALTPLRRAGAPLDVARAALFLASEAGDYITGVMLPVAGGD
ncbi:MAG: SDR family oxidoreductase [Candidatus Omnitrophica bacterium]|nr:SDR family oxidoreductase [Candidatus Omnitrophota bacterium]